MRTSHAFYEQENGYHDMLKEMRAGTSLAPRSCGMILERKESAGAQYSCLLLFLTANGLSRH
jgi:hypothetical protein